MLNCSKCGLYRITAFFAIILIQTSKLDPYPREENWKEFYVLRQFLDDSPAINMSVVFCCLVIGLGLGLGFYFGYTDWYKSQYFYYSLCLAIYPWQWKPQD